MNQYILLITICLIIVIIALTYILNLDKNEWFTMTKPIDVMTSENILNMIRKTLKDVDSIFKNNDITYWMNGGTLLGAIRNGDVIPWDDDADLYVLLKDKDKILSLKPIFNKYGYDIVEHWIGFKIFPLNGYKINNKKEFNYKFPFVDIFITEQEGDKVIDNAEYCRYLWPNSYFKINELYPLKSYKFNNFELMGPNDPIPYLDRLYGRDWRYKAYKSSDHGSESGFPRQEIEFDVDLANSNIEKATGKKTKPVLWIYWENKPGSTTPPYISLCIKTIYKHCSKSFEIIQLDNTNINDYLPELTKNNSNLDFSKLLIAQKVDFYRIMLLKKYGGLYLDADTILLKDPIEIMDKLKDYDFVGFGCTGHICTDGYGEPSNWALASRRNGKLMTNVLINLEKRLKELNEKKDMEIDYHDMGKFPIREELEKLIKNENYKYYHYSNDYSGIRDINGKWVNCERVFSTEKIEYKYPDKMLFLVLYNSGLDDFKNMSEEELLWSNMNISKFFRQSLQ